MANTYLLSRLDILHREVQSVGLDIRDYSEITSFLLSGMPVWAFPRLAAEHTVQWSFHSTKWTWEDKLCLTVWVTEVYLDLFLTGHTSCIHVSMLALSQCFPNLFSRRTLSYIAQHFLYCHTELKWSTLHHKGQETSKTCRTLFHWGLQNIVLCLNGVAGDLANVLTLIVFLRQANKRNSTLHEDFKVSVVSSSNNGNKAHRKTV